MVRKRIKIDINEEPEIQYVATPKLFAEIEKWLEKRGGVLKREQEDDAVYFDTKNYRLLREGIEYRIKPKGDSFKHDLKTPLDTHNREVAPDADEIVWRNELRFKANARPSLSVFWDQAILQPVRERVERFFDKELLPQFRAHFKKRKMDIDTADAEVEYSFQTGRMRTIDGKNQTPLMRILELELRHGDVEGLIAEKKALEKAFLSKGLVILDRRKVIMGFELISPDMDAKQRCILQDVLARNSFNSVEGSTEPKARGRALRVA